MKLFAITGEKEIELLAGKAAAVAGNATLQLRWDNVKSGWVVRVRAGGRILPNRRISGSDRMDLGVASELAGPLNITAMDAMGGSEERGMWEITLSATPADGTKRSPKADPARPSKPDPKPPLPHDPKPEDTTKWKKIPTPAYPPKGGPDPAPLHGLEEDIERLEAQKKALLDHKEALERECADLTREAAELSDKKAEAQSAVASLQGEKKALDKQLGDAKAEVKAATMDLADKKSELESKQSEAKSAREALAEAQKTAEDAGEELGRLQKEASSTAQILERIRSELTALKSSHTTEAEALEKLKQLRDSQGLRDGEIAAAQEALQAAEALLEGLKQKNEQLQGEINEATADQTRLVTSQATLVDGNKALRQKVDELEIERQLLEAQAESNLEIVKQRLAEIFKTLDCVKIISRDTEANITVARQALQADSFEEMKGEVGALLEQVEQCAMQMTSINDRIAAVVNSRYEGNTKTPADKRRKS